MIKNHKDMTAEDWVETILGWEREGDNPFFISVYHAEFISKHLVAMFKDDVSNYEIVNRHFQCPNCGTVRTIRIPIAYKNPRFRTENKDKPDYE